VLNIEKKLSRPNCQIQTLFDKQYLICIQAQHDWMHGLNDGIMNYENLTTISALFKTIGAGNLITFDQSCR